MYVLQRTNMVLHNQLNLKIKKKLTRDTANLFFTFTSRLESKIFYRSFQVQTNLNSMCIMPQIRWSSQKQFLFIVACGILLGKSNDIDRGREREKEWSIFRSIFFRDTPQSYKRIAHKWDAYINKHFPVLYHKYFFH